MGEGLDLICACLTVSLFNLAVFLSHGTLLLASLPMDETFSATAILQLHIWLSEERPVSGVHLTFMDMIWMMGGTIGLQFACCELVALKVLVDSLNKCQCQMKHGGSRQRWPQSLFTAAGIERDCGALGSYACKKMVKKKTKNISLS